jgi:hypothetical protein
MLEKALSLVKRTFMAYLAVRIRVNKPSGKKGIPNARESPKFDNGPGENPP